MTTPNTALAYQALDAALAHPDHFYMGQWCSSDDRVGLDDLTGPDCGTTACYAGWVAAISGYQVDGDGYVFRGGELVGDVDVVAAGLLGVGLETTDRLFYVDDAEIAAAVEDVFGPRPERVS